MHILTAIDVFSQYLFAIPVKAVDAHSIAKALVSLFLRHTYIPKKIITDKGSVFTSKLFHEIAQLLDVEISHATIKHAQTIGALERRHAEFKKTLQVFENEKQNNWHHFVDYALYTHNSTYNPKTGCTPSDLFHGHSPDKPLHLRFCAQSVRNPAPRFALTSQIQDRLLKMYASQKEHLTTRYYKHKEFYDKKAAAQPLKQKDYCLLLNPLYDTQKQVMHKMQPKWLATYIVESCYSDENYLIRKANTRYTQYVNRIRLRPFKPQYAVKDLKDIQHGDFQSDPTFKEGLKEPGLLDTVREHLHNPSPPATTAPQRMVLQRAGPPAVSFSLGPTANVGSPNNQPSLLDSPLDPRLPRVVTPPTPPQRRPLTPAPRLPSIPEEAAWTVEHFTMPTMGGRVAPWMGGYHIPSSM